MMTKDSRQYSKSLTQAAVMLCKEEFSKHSNASLALLKGYSTGSEKKKAELEVAVSSPAFDAWPVGTNSFAAAFKALACSSAFASDLQSPKPCL